MAGRQFGAGSAIRHRSVIAANALGQFRPHAGAGVADSVGTSGCNNRQGTIHTYITLVCARNPSLKNPALAMKQDMSERTFYRYRTRALHAVADAALRHFAAADAQRTASDGAVGGTGRDSGPVPGGPAGRTHGPYQWGERRREDGAGYEGCRTVAPQTFLVHDTGGTHGSVGQLCVCAGSLSA